MQVAVTNIIGLYLYDNFVHDSVVDGDGVTLECVPPSAQCRCSAHMRLQLPLVLGHVGAGGMSCDVLQHGKSRCALGVRGSSRNLTFRISCACARGPQLGPYLAE